MPEKFRAVGEQDSVKQSVTIELSRFAYKALAGEGRDDSMQAPATMEVAVRCYLDGKDARRPGWSYPSVLRGRVARRGVPVEMSIDDDLWRSFEEEADRQGVSVQEMSEHAALYFAAEVDAGRITGRILDNLEAESKQSKED